MGTRELHLISSWRGTNEAELKEACEFAIVTPPKLLARPCHYTVVEVCKARLIGAANTAI
jgi:hypothetical protein